jgi:hypothetical protein
MARIRGSVVNLEYYIQGFLRSKVLHGALTIYFKF